MTDPVMLLSQAHGEGRVTFRALRAAGFYTLAAVAEAQIQVLADRAHLSTQTARRLKAGAEEMVGKGIGKDFPAPDPQGRASRGRGAKAAARRQADGPAFAEGLSVEEALMLGQGAVTPPAEEPHPPSRPAPADDPGHPLAAPPAPGEQLSGPLIVSMAAAAQAAAALPRVGASAPQARSGPGPGPAAPPAPERHERPAQPRPPEQDDEPDETFWTFG